MIIKKVVLENIRSYVKEEVDFPLGNVLLAGDIGSGKTTILLSIEFALFGIIRGEVSSDALLRYGAERGSVELFINLDGKEIQIKRILKRTSSGISQESGFLVIDDVAQQLSLTELKQRILDLLNYPKDMLTKKSLVYRYTVYTPQENMKAILSVDKETRIDTLRKVFNIDKYKRVKDNAKILIQELKYKRKEFASLIYDLEEKKENLVKRESSLQVLVEEKKKINLDSVKDLVGIHKEKIKVLETSMDAIKTLKNDLAVKTNKLENLERLEKSNSSLLNDLSKGLDDFEKDLEGLDMKGVSKEERWKYEDTIKVFEEQLITLVEDIAKIKGALENSKDLKNKIVGMNNCPTCLQPVSSIHKDKIAAEEIKKINSFKSKLEELLHRQEDVKGILQKSKEKLDMVKAQEAKLGMQAMRKQDVERRKEQIRKLKEDQERLVLEVSELKQQKIIIEADLVRMGDVSQAYEDSKKELDSLLVKERELEIEYATKEKEVGFLQQSIEDLKREIKEKESYKKRLTKYTKNQEMLEGIFLPLVDKIEKTVLLNVQRLFNSVFEEWFALLVNDENFSVSVDENFSPLINYSEYDVNFNNLSGGEKTACALAYRLALNNVINHIMARIKTKDLIILDEPTDGFSSEQLDKMRDVFSSLDVKQNIIVSHESKVESFVDSIIRIEKKEGRSFVNYS